MKRLLLALLPLTLHAATIEQTYDNEVGHAKKAITQSLNSEAFKQFNADEYCADAACVNDIHNPSQSQYFDNDAALTNDGQQQFLTNPEAINISEGYLNRDTVTIDLNDPDMYYAKLYMDNSYEISHGISNKYVDCDDGKLCKYENTTRQCSEPTGNPAYCHSEAYAIGSETHEENQSFTVNGTLGSYTLTKQQKVTQIDTPTLNTDREQNWDHCQNADVPQTMTLWVNGSKISTFTGTRHDTKTGHGIFNMRCYSSYTVPARQTVLNPPRDLRTFSLTVKVGGTTLTPKGHDYVTAHFKKKTIQMGWRDNCKGVPTQCSQTQEICVEGAETRYIEGVPVYLDCWKKKRTYQCNSTNTCAPLLGKSITGPDLVCQVNNSSCKTQLFGVCIENSVNLQCEERQCEDHQLVCGSNFFCLDGDCYDGQAQKNDNFSDSASALAGLGEAAASLNADDLSIFTGKAASCDKKPVGLSDCCADKGWGNDIGLTQCSAEEKALAQAKEKGLTVYLGRYCAEEVLGACIRKKQGYCQFDSKMARIIQEQGRTQIGMNFGSAKTPQCQGFTPEQMQQMDFDAIDFSDFYDDLDEGMNLPDMGDLQDKINDKYHDLGGQ
ncbi:TPA: type-F conjugative transfer system mating-pair stabilization protein TraN [Photobacterium damselae]